MTKEFNRVQRFAVSFTGEYLKLLNERIDKSIIEHEKGYGDRNPAFVEELEDVRYGIKKIFEKQIKLLEKTNVDLTKEFYGK
jgi:hypothetical protein